MSGDDDRIEEMECPHCEKVTALGREYDVVWSSKDSVGDEYKVDERPTQVKCENCGKSFWIIHKIRD